MDFIYDEAMEATPSEERSEIYEAASMTLSSEPECRFTLWKFFLVVAGAMAVNGAHSEDTPLCTLYLLTKGLATHSIPEILSSEPEGRFTLGKIFVFVAGAR